MNHQKWITVVILISLVCCCTRQFPEIPANAPTPTDHADMVKLPGGTFTMGCVVGDIQYSDDEIPAHRVTLSPFWLDVHEVTVGQYSDCVAAGVCSTPLEACPTEVCADNNYDFAFNWGKPDRENYPVNGVIWDIADDYCRWRGKRLPTEAEFEYALRGGKEGLIYPWGNETMPPVGWGNFADASFNRRFPDDPHLYPYTNDDGYDGTAPVCSFSKNPFGLCDISGNVAEWCSDWFNGGYYEVSPEFNPSGASEGIARAMRGGSWESCPWCDSASTRAPGMPSYMWGAVGFRCATN